MTGVLKMIVVGLVGAAAAVHTGRVVDPQIGSGPPRPGLQDAQNEPAIAVDTGAIARKASSAPLVVGANDYWDETICGGRVACTFASGVGISGVYFSFDGGT